MNTNSYGLMTLGIIIAFTALTFVFWVVGLLLLWMTLKILGISTDLWAMIGALSTAVTAAAVFSAGFVAYREISEVASSRHMEVADRLFEELNSPENIGARRWIFQNLPDDPKDAIRTMTSDGQAAVKQVLNSLDHVAFLTQAGWIPDEIIMPWMHPMIVKSWNKLEPYVEYERERRNEPYYYVHVTRLADRCKSWRKKNLSDTRITWVEGAL